MVGGAGFWCLGDLELQGLGFRLQVGGARRGFLEDPWFRVGVPYLRLWRRPFCTHMWEFPKIRGTLFGGSL